MAAAPGPPVHWCQYGTTVPALRCSPQWRKAPSLTARLQPAAVAFTFFVLLLVQLWRGAAYWRNRWGGLPA